MRPSNVETNIEKIIVKHIFDKEKQENKTLWDRKEF